MKSLVSFSILSLVIISCQLAQPQNTPPPRNTQQNGLSLSPISCDSNDNQSCDRLQVIQSLNVVLDEMTKNPDSFQAGSKQENLEEILSYCKENIAVKGALKASGANPILSPAANSNLEKRTAGNTSEAKECDFNQDGKINAIEKRKCGGMGGGTANLQAKNRMNSKPVLSQNFAPIDPLNSVCKKIKAFHDRHFRTTIAPEIIDQEPVEPADGEQPTQEDGNQSETGGSGIEQPTLAYENSKFGIFSAFNHEAFTPFQLDAGMEPNNPNEFWDFIENHVKTLGAHWTRSNLNLVWHGIEPELGQGYDWNPVNKNGRSLPTEDTLKRIYQSKMHWLGVFMMPGNREGKVAPRIPVDHPTEFVAFVKAAVERFNGDGKDDLDASVKVKYWQIGNEMMFCDDEFADNYVGALKLAYQAIKEVDPLAKVVLSADIGKAIDGQLPECTRKIFAGFKGGPAPFDVIDIHHWGTASEWKLRFIEAYQSLLKSYNIEGIKFWSTENGTWEGQPGGKSLQSEEDQAKSLVKRFVYNLNHGVDKLFWNNLVEWHNFSGKSDSQFNSMGLISDSKSPGEASGRFNTERMAYWSYKLLASLIDSHQATALGQIDEALLPKGVYGFSYLSQKEQKEFYILWSETEDIALSLPVTGENVSALKMVSDRFGKFENKLGLAVQAGNVSVTVGSIPTLIGPDAIIDRVTE